MGRAKVRMEPINNNRQRKLTFQKRKDGLMKKAQELSTLCDINVSMIICSDHQKPQIFPDYQKLNAMINLYEQQQKVDPGKIHHYSLSDFFNDRKIKIEKELAEAKKKNLKAKYPNWFDFLNDSSEVELRELAFGLEAKIQIVKRKMENMNTPKIQMNLDHHANFYPPCDFQTSFVIAPSINPNSNSELELIMRENHNVNCYDYQNLNLQPQSEFMPMSYNHLVDYDPSSRVFADQDNNFMKQSGNPNSELELLMRESHNVDCYDHQNLNLQRHQTPMMIPKNYNDLVFADQNNNFMMQSENPNLETLKLVRGENEEDCYDYESFSFEPEIPEMPPFMQITSHEFSGTNGINYHYIV